MAEDVIEEVVTPEQAAKDEAAAFAAGFIGEPVAEPDPEPAPPVEEPLDAAVVEEALKEPTLLPGYTPEQITGLLAKVAEFDSLNSKFDKLAGHIGNMMQEVKTLKTPAKEELPKVDVKQFASDFEDIASYTHQTVEERLERRMAEYREQMMQEQLKARLDEEQEKLTEAHEDWAMVVDSPDYKVWLATQPADYQKIANETTSARALGKVLTAFKDVGKKTVVQAANKDRLEAALTPTGAVSPRPAEVTEAEAFAAGFKSVIH